MANGDVVIGVNYLKRLDLYDREKPFQLFFPVNEDAKDQRESNLEFHSCPQKIEDVRDRKYHFKLDTHGFRFVDQATSLTVEDLKDRRRVEDIYLPEMESILKSIDSTSDRIFFFDWRLRDSAVPQLTAKHDLNDLTNWLRPSSLAHIDQSPKAVMRRIQLQLEKDSDFLLKSRRIRIINLWRPLTDVVEDWPLAICDSRSVADEDLVECDYVRRRYIGEALYLHHNTQHKWHYLGQQTPNEVLLMKMFDSDDHVEGRRCAHTSFKHPRRPQHAPSRKSLEVRAMVFNYALGIPIEHHDATIALPDTSD